MKNRHSLLTAVLLFPMAVSPALAQGPVAAPSAPSPQRPAQTPAAPALPGPYVPPAAPAAPVDPLPQANPKMFTATSPTLDTVNAFLRQVWGYDPNRLWRVMAIMPTPAPGVTKVVAFVTDKSPDAKIQQATFYVTPDGKHAIGDGATFVNFGATPFAAARDLLKEKADGAYRGAASKDFELVEFADLQCPVCKQAQDTVDQIVKDFPNAHVVFQLLPLVDIHTSAFKAAAYGVCAEKQGSDAFFKFASGVFDTQEGLTPATDDAVLKAAAKRAGLDGDAIAACANTQATKDVVNADMKLAEDVGVAQTPTLSVNGRMLPLVGIDYNVLKRIIQFQATLDGVNSGATAETLAPKPPQPTLQTLPK